MRGQRLLDNAPCQAVAGLDSGALLLPRYCASLVQTKADRHANGSPFGGAGEELATRLRGLGRCQTALAQRSYRSDKEPAHRCACASFLPGLPSPSLLRNATSPKGRGFGRPHRFLYLFGELYVIMVLRFTPRISRERRWTRWPIFSHFWYLSEQM